MRTAKLLRTRGVNDADFCTATLVRAMDRRGKSRGQVPCFDPDFAPVPACGCAQMSTCRQPEPGLSLKLVPTFVEASFEHEKFSTAPQIKFALGTRSPTLQSYILAFVRKQDHGLHALAVWERHER